MIFETVLYTTEANLLNGLAEKIAQGYYVANSLAIGTGFAKQYAVTYGKN